MKREIDKFIITVGEFNPTLSVINRSKQKIIKDIEIFFRVKQDAVFTLLDYILTDTSPCHYI